MSKNSRKKKKKTQASRKESDATGVIKGLPDKQPSKEKTTDFTKVIEGLKGGVYSVSRLRQEGTYVTTRTLGTSFLVAPNVMITCAHVIKDPGAKDEMSVHRDGDLYYFIQKDEYGNAHWYVLALTLDRDIHLLEDIDLAIIDLPDHFYESNGKTVKGKEDHLVLDRDPLPLGADIGVLGYPIEDVGIKFSANDSIDHRTIQLRANRGVVNTRFRDVDRNLYMYQFTIPFNPGNSGGPIFDARNGKVIGMVKEFQTFPVQELLETFEVTDDKGNKTTITLPARVRSSYAGGIATESLLDSIQTHIANKNKK